jgi:hypothetical protein
MGSRSHEVALRYVSGVGDHPNSVQMEDLRDSLYNTVVHVDDLHSEIIALKQQAAALITENNRLRSEVVQGTGTTDLKFSQCASCQVFRSMMESAVFTLFARQLKF